jgi:adrenodoxin-NADP+ reductase
MCPLFPFSILLAQTNSLYSPNEQQQEALPTPFGLVRSGVAPDHPDTKNVVNHFTDLAKTSRVRFLGNVRVGSPALSLAELRKYYNAVVLAYGAESDRRLGIPGENAPNVFSAREFVWWYNGHPSAATLPIDMRNVKSVAVVGLGNVALDCARVLLSTPTALGKTDIAQHALQALRQSSVEEVHLIGRRGPAQAAFTPKELRELVSMEGIDTYIHPQGCLELAPACQKELKESRIKRRVVEVLSKTSVQQKQASAAASGPNRRLHFHFLSSPLEILPVPSADDSKNADVTTEEKTSETPGFLRVERTALRHSVDNQGRQIAVGTGAFENIPAQLVLQSVGYRSVAMDGAPFDPERGVIPNVLGQVMTQDGSGAEPGLFVCGWLKRGPTGIIGTNLVDAEQTVDTIARARDALPPILPEQKEEEGVAALLRRRGVQVVDFAGWERIDEEEQKRGAAVGKPREKLVDEAEMVRVAFQEQK